MATRREMLNVIAAGEMNDDVQAWAVSEIAKLDAANEKRRNKMSKKAEANLPIIASIEEVLTSEPQTATVIGEKVGISTQKASALLRQIVSAGKAEKVEVKIKGKGTQKGYLVG